MDLSSGTNEFLWGGNSNQGRRELHHGVLDLNGCVAIRFATSSAKTNATLHLQEASKAPPAMTKFVP